MIGMLPCREVVDSLSDWLEGVLGLRRGLQVRLHLRLCPICRAYARQFRRVWEALSRLEPLVPPEALEARYGQAVRVWLGDSS